jgi:hypothetical protein
MEGSRPGLVDAITKFAHARDSSPKTVSRTGHLLYQVMFGLVLSTVCKTDNIDNYS